MLSILGMCKLRKTENARVSVEEIKNWRFKRKKKKKKKKVMQKISNIDQVLKTREKRKEGSKRNKMVQ